MKKIFTFFAIAMMAITASAKVYEVSFDKSENITIFGGQTRVINGVKITVNNGYGSIRPHQRTGHNWRGDGTENDFQISTENGETITNIEITTEEESRWSISDLYGTGWTTITKGISWTGSATSVNVGGEFEMVIKLTVTVDDSPTALENTAAEVKSVKVIENGQVVIIRDGVRYNAVGAKL